MSEGWIKLHRKIRTNPVFNDLQLFRLWTICLLEASHSSRDQAIGKQVVPLEPGQFVTGRFDLHGMYNSGLKRSDHVAEYTVWRWLLALEKQGLVSISSSNKYSIVSVENWSFYQDNEQQNEQVNEQEVSNKRATNEQQVSTNKNVKNLKNEKNLKKEDIKPSSRQPKTYAEDSAPFKMAVYLHTKIMEYAESISKAHLVRDANMQKWADSCRLILEKDKREKTEVFQVIQWATADSFWQGNILSPDTLRKQYVKLCIAMGQGKVNEKSGGIIQGVRTDGDASARTGVQQAESKVYKGKWDDVDISLPTV